MFASAVPLWVAFAVLAGTGLAVRIGLVLAVLGGFYSVTVGGCYFPHYFTMGLTGPVPVDRARRPCLEPAVG